MDWKVGDTAICINNGNLKPDLRGVPPLLKLHAKYIVNGIKTCTCGRISLDVGVVSTFSLGTMCMGCHNIMEKSDVHWCAAERFTKEYTEEHLEEAVKSENYELAAEIRDKLK